MTFPTTPRPGRPGRRRPPDHTMTFPTHTLTATPAACRRETKP